MKSKIFVSGLNDQSQLGVESDSKSKDGFLSVVRPHQLNFSASHLVKISSGEYHTVYLFDNGQVFATGSDINFRIGSQFREKFSTITPIQLIQEKIVDIHSGSQYTAYLTETGLIMMCSEKLANHQIVMRMKRKIVKISGNDEAPCAIDNNGNFYLFDPDPQEPPKKYRLSSEAVDIARGHKFSLVLTAEGVVYGNGRVNSAGRSRKFQQIASLQGIKCKSVYASQNHAAVVSKNGRVFFWGDGSAGQLGNGTKEDNEEFEELSIGVNKRVSSVGLGLYHSVIATEDGEVYSMGENSCGQLGLGNLQRATIPTQSKIFPQRVTDISCGSYNTFFICRKSST